MTTTLRPAPLSTRRFTYDGGKFIAEASDLGRGFNFGRVWDDSADEGLTLVSHTTGREVVCVVDHVEVRDGDILFWRLAPVNAPASARFHVVVFND